MKLNLTEIQELENSIADRISLQIATWHLYLGDAGLAKPLTLECIAKLDQGPDLAARQALESVQVSLAGGGARLPLARLIPSTQLLELEEILDPYCR